MAIQLFMPTFHTEECISEIKECLDKGWTGLGYKTVLFEEKWKEFSSMPYAHFLNSATVGLHLAIKIFKSENNWNEEDEVISTPITFVSTNHAIGYEGLKVVFADVDEYLCIDPVDIKKKITERTKAILYVGLGGNTGRYKEIVEICKEHKLKLILDASHMVGTRLDGEIVGRDADAVIYSFQAVKNLPTADSGMLCFMEEKYDALARQYSWLGINKDTYSRANDDSTYKWKYDVNYLGYKYHGNSIMASIGMVQLKYIEQDNAYRRQIARWYDDGFSKYAHKIKVIPTANGCESSRHLYIISVENRDGLLKHLNDNDIYPGVHYRDNTEYPMYSYAKGSCPNAHRLSNSVLSLPLHLRLTRSEIETVIKAVIQYISR